MSTPIGALLPAQSQATQVPYLTAAQFTAWPTWLDLDNLVPGGLASLQLNELSEVLLTASAWADSCLNGMRLGAHFVQNETRVTRVIDGRVQLLPRDIPVCGVTSLTYGWSSQPQYQSPLVLSPNPFTVELDGRVLGFAPQNLAGPGQTGGGAYCGGGYGGGGKVYVNWSYVAGFATTALAEPCSAGDTSITVTDPTAVMPGLVLRAFDEGQTQQGATDVLVVDASYVPQVPTVPPTVTEIPLATGGTPSFDHAAGVGVTGFPRDALQAVVVYAVSLMMKEDVSAMEPDSGFGPAARTTDENRSGGASGGLLNDAVGWLMKYGSPFR